MSYWKNEVTVMIVIHAFAAFSYSVILSRPVNVFQELFPLNGVLKYIVAIHFRYDLEKICCHAVISQMITKMYIFNNVGLC